MLIQILNYFTSETIYLWFNYGVIPLWLALIFFPNSKLTEIFLTSILLPLIFASVYIYLAYKIIYSSENFLEIFDIYLSLNNLSDLLSNELFLLIFWIHFLAISLFLGSWISKDATRYNVPKIVYGPILIIVYLTGPVGLVIYWFIRIFFAKKIALYD